MSDVYDDGPQIEQPEPLEPEDAADVAPRDSEIDFDDDTDDDQVPIDELEAQELGALLDDPERLEEDEES